MSWRSRSARSWRARLTADQSRIVEVRDAKVVYWQTYTDHDQARRDLGLED
jgi:hypothetical protein